MRLRDNSFGLRIAFRATDSANAILVTKKKEKRKDEPLLSRDLHGDQVH